MGTLKPGVKYVYERVNGTTYARKFGSPSNERIVIGYDWSAEDQQIGMSSRDRIAEDQLWNNVRNFARTNETLQSELDRVIMLYNLLKQHDISGA